MDLLKLKISRSGRKAINDYIYHKDKSALIKVIREEPETLAESPILRNFIADIIEGNPYSRRKKPKHIYSKRVQERNCEVLERIAFYIGYGYPIKLSGGKDSCCTAVANEFNLSPETVETEIYRKHKEFTGCDEDVLFAFMNGTKLYNSYIAGRKASGATSPPPKCEFVERILKGKPWEWGSYEEE